MKNTMIILSLFILSACSSDESAQLKSTTTSDTLKAGVIPLNEQPAKTVIEMINWYRNNQDIRGCMVNNSCGEWDSTKYYSVNVDSTEAYLTNLKKSGFFSETYLTDWRNYFNKCDADLKENPQNDGPPEGFEYDFVMMGQDYEQELAHPEKATVVKMTGSETKKTIVLDFHTGGILTYEMSSLDGKWYIDKIGS